jgi:hypothetical protein
MTDEPTSGHLLSPLGIEPDQRCESVGVVFLAVESYELRCARHHQHDASEAHTEGEGAFWGNDGEVEYR